MQSAPGLPGIAIVDRRVAFCYLSGMSQPVKLSDGLVLDARITGEIAERSIAGQIEFWARVVNGNHASAWEISSKI